MDINEILKKIYEILDSYNSLPLTPDHFEKLINKKDELFKNPESFSEGVKKKLFDVLQKLEKELTTKNCDHLLINKLINRFKLLNNQMHRKEVIEIILNDNS